MKHFFSLGAIIVSLMVVTLEGCAQKTSLVLTKEGVGCLKFGMKFDEIPSACKGFYDRVERKKEAFEGEGSSGVAEIYSFYLGNELVARASRTLTAGETGIEYDHDYTWDILSGIIVYSSNISTPEGVYPGMPIKKLLMIKGGDEGIYCPDEMDDPLRIRIGQNNLSDNDYSEIVIDHETDLTDLGKKAIEEEGLKNDCQVKLKNSYFKPNAKITSLSKYHIP